MNDRLVVHRRRRVRLGVVLTALLLIGARAPSWPCSMGTHPVEGPFSYGSGWLLGASKDWSSQGLESFVLVQLDDAGFDVDQRPVDLGVAGLRTSLVGVEDTGLVWIRTSCAEGVRDDLCDRLVLVDEAGSVVESVDSRDRNTAWVRTFGLVVGSIERSKERPESRPRLRIERLGASSGKLHEIEVPRSLGDGSQLLWRMNAAGEVAILAGVGDEIVIGRWSAEGDMRSLSSYERALRGSLDLGDGITRLAHPWVVELFDDGRLLLSGWGYRADCSSDRPPGFVILDRDGDVQIDAELTQGKGRVWAAGLRPDGSFVLRAQVMLSFDADGTLRDEWPVMPRSWTRTEGELAERAEQVGPDAGPAAWVELFEHATLEKRRQLEQWIVESWPESDSHLSDRQWINLSSELCRRHPESAAGAVLGRFRGTDERERGKWLGGLMRCFPVRAPQGILEVAVAVLEGRLPGSRWEAEQARDLWQGSQDRSRRLWSELQQQPYLDAGVLAKLVKDWPAARGRFEGALNNEDSREHARARDALLSTIEWWDPAQGFADGSLDEAREEVLASAREWAAVVEEPIATYGGLLLLGHLADEPRALAQLLETKTRKDRDLDRWLAAAVNGALSRGAELDDLEEIALGVLRRAPEGTVDQEGVQALEQVYVVLAGRLGRAGVEELVRRAASSTADRAARQRVLDVSLFAFEPGFWRAALASDWLVDDCTVHAADFFDLGYRLIGRAFADEAALGDVLVDRLRERFVNCGESSRELSSLTTRHPPSGLLQTIHRADVEAVVSKSKLGLESWMGLVARVGAWPSIEDELLSRLDQPQRVLAAAALAPLGHQQALDVLLREGIADLSVPPHVFRADRERIIETLSPRLGSVYGDERVRWLSILRTLGPSSAVVGSCRAEIERAYSSGQLPLLEDVMLVHDSGDEAVLEDWIQRFSEGTLRPQHRSFRVDFASVDELARWLLPQGMKRRQLMSKLLEQLDMSDSVEGRAWSYRLFGDQ